MGALLVVAKTIFSAPDAIAHVGPIIGDIRIRKEPLNCVTLDGRVGPALRELANID